MAIKKADIKINDSDYFKEVFLFEDPTKAMVTEQNFLDPGLLARENGYTNDEWKLIYKFNSVVDPFEDMGIGESLNVPSLDDMKRLKQI